MSNPSILNSNPPILQPSSICQVAVVVRDIEKAAQTYADLFGVSKPNVIVTDSSDKAHTNYRGKDTEARAKLAFFNLGALTLELIEPVGGPSVWKEVLDQNGPSIHHIAFRVPNMGESVAQLDANGIPTVQRGDFTGGCYAYCDGSEKLGAVIELLASTPKK